VNIFQRVAVAVRRLTRMVWGRYPPRRGFYGRLGDERNYEGLVGDGRGSALLMSCVSWVVNAFTQMRPIVVELTDDDELAAEQVVGHPLARLFRRPTFDPQLGRSYYTWITMIAGVLISYIVDGNAYLLKIRGAGGAGRPVQLWYVPHFMMEPRWDMDDPTRFILGYDYAPDGTGLPSGPMSVANPDGSGPVYWVAVDDVIHLRDGLDPDNSRKGLSKVKTLLREIYTDEEGARFTASLLRNHGAPGIVVAPKQPLANPDDATEVKQRLMVDFTGDRRGEPIVLKGPSEVTQFGFSPEQMKLGDIRDIPEERISAAVGIPAAVVGFGAGLQSTKVGATMAELVDLAWQNGVLPRAIAIAAEITEQLLTDFENDAGEGIEFVFDTSKVPIMADYHLKVAQRWDVAVKGGWVQVAEARRGTGLKVGPRDKVYLRQIQMQEIDATKKPVIDGTPVVPALAPAAPTAALGPGEQPPAEQPAAKAVQDPEEVEIIVPRPKRQRPVMLPSSEPAWVYFIGQDYDTPIKIGVSVDPDERLNGIQTGHPERLSVLARIPGTQQTEAELHRKFAHLRMQGEWFKPDPALRDFIISATTAAREDIGNALGEGITHRQAEVASLITDGLTNKEIAARLGISERTVEREVTATLSAANVDNRTDLTRLLKGETQTN